MNKEFLEFCGVKVWWRYKIYPKKRNKIKGSSITCRHIWLVDIPKCVYWLDTHSIKVWWRYMLPNANAVHFCDIIFGHMAVLPKCLKKSVGSKKSKNLPCIISHFVICQFIQSIQSIQYLHQTFTDYVFNLCTHLSMLTCQMWLQVMEVSLIQLHFLEFSYITTWCLKSYSFIKLLQIVYLST